jgi:hypothetical protein
MGCSDALGSGRGFLNWAWGILWLSVGFVIPLSLGGRAASTLRLWSDVEWW